MREAGAGAPQNLPAGCLLRGVLRRRAEVGVFAGLEEAFFPALDAISLGLTSLDASWPPPICSMRNQPCFTRPLFHLSSPSQRKMHLGPPQPVRL
jgi:hypothetical protein